MTTTHANEGRPAECLSTEEEIDALTEFVGSHNEVLRNQDFRQYVRHEIGEYLHETEEENHHLAA